MPSPAKKHFPEVDCRPPATNKKDETDTKDKVVPSNGHQGPSVLHTALDKETAVDKQGDSGTDTDTDSLEDLAGEKDVETKAAAQGRPQPQPQAQLQTTSKPETKPAENTTSTVAAPCTVAASTNNGTTSAASAGGARTADGKQKDKVTAASRETAASKTVASKTAVAVADAAGEDGADTSDSSSCLPLFHRRRDEDGNPHKGPLARVLDKVRPYQTQHRIRRGSGHHATCHNATCSWPGQVAAVKQPCGWQQILV